MGIGVLFSMIWNKVHGHELWSDTEYKYAYYKSENSPCVKSENIEALPKHCQAQELRTSGAHARANCSSKRYTYGTSFVTSKLNIH